MFSAWLKDHRFSTHAIVAAIGGLAVLIETNQHVRSLMESVFDHHTRIVPLLSALGAVLLAYRDPRRPARPEDPTYEPEDPYEWIRAQAAADRPAEARARGGLERIRGRGGRPRQAKEWPAIESWRAWERFRGRR